MGSIAIKKKRKMQRMLAGFIGDIIMMIIALFLAYMLRAWVIGF